MQNNNYHSSSHQAHSGSHPSHSPDDYPLSYPDPSHQHAALPYAAVSPATPLSSGSIAHQSISPSYPYSPYATQGTSDDHRSYFVPTSQGSTTDHYPTASSPTTSYTTPGPSGHLTTHPSQHHAHLQQQQQFIPTPSQTYHYSSTGSAPPTRSRSVVEPYYHMSPNPQHVLHAPPASTTHGPGSSRSGTAHGHSSGSSHSLHHPQAQACNHALTGTIVAASGERYQCNRCDRSFTRSHDRRRHYETVHSTSPVLHKCRFCHRDFSRSDSLKRHVDNGCAGDEMPR